jgi:chromosome segregation ATPase
MSPIFRPAALAVVTGLAALGVALLTAPPATAGPEPAPQETTAQTPSADAMVTALRQELAGMRRSLDEISLLLAATLDQHQVAVLMTRIELKQRRMSPLEEHLQRTRDERDGMQQNRAQMIDMEETIRAEVGESEEEQQQMRLDLAHFQREMDRMDDRIAVLDQRIIELEDDLSRNQDDIAVLEEMVDERLDLR